MRRIILFAMAFASTFASSQEEKSNFTNVIPNPSFEDRTGCPSIFGFGTLPNVHNWVTAGGGTSDYLNECDFQGFPVPPNSPAGDGYVGFGNT